MDVREDYVSNLQQLYIAVHSCGDHIPAYLFTARQSRDRMSGVTHQNLIGYISAISKLIHCWFSPKLAATLRWFTAGGAIRIALRQLSQTCKLRHYDVITWKL